MVGSIAYEKCTSSNASKKNFPKKIAKTGSRKAKNSENLAVGAMVQKGTKNRVNGGAVGSPPSKLVRRYVHIGEKTGVGPLVGDARETRER